MAKISKNIKNLRKEKNLTQDALAEMLNVTRQAISNWENDKTQPDIDTLERMAAALGVEPEELLYGTKKTAGGEPDKSKQRNLIKIILATVGSVSVGVGLVLIFFRLWSIFSLTVQTLFSVIPILIGQGFAVFVFLKKRKSTAWRESAALIWVIGVISTVALINSVLNIHCGYINCLVIDAVLSISIFFLLDAVSPLAVYFYMAANISAYMLNEINFDNSYVYSLISIALFAVGVLFTVLVSRDKDAPRGKYAQWLAAISGMNIVYFGFASLFNEYIGNDFYAFSVIIIMIMSLCMYILAPQKDDYTLPYKPLGIFGICLGMTMGISLYVDKSTDITGKEILLSVIIAVLSLLPLVFAFLRRKTFKGNACRLAVCAFCEAGIASVYLEFVSHRDVAAGITALLAAAIGITLIVYGVKAVKFLAVNGGMAALLAVLAALYSKLGDWDYAVWGVILLIFGGVLIFINARLLSQKRLMSSLAEKEGDGNAKKTDVSDTHMRNYIPAFHIDRYDRLQHKDEQ